MEKFNFYKHNYFIFETLFSEEFDVRSAEAEIYSFLKNTYKRNEIDGKTIGIALYNQEDDLCHLFNGDCKYGSPFFQITRIEAIQRLRLLKTHLFLERKEYDIKNIILPHDWEDEDSEYIGFEIYDSTKSKTRRYFERIRDKFRNSRVFMWCQNNYERIIGNTPKTATGWKYRN